MEQKTTNYCVFSAAVAAQQQQRKALEEMEIKEKERHGFGVKIQSRVLAELGMNALHGAVD